jgi:membrane fusion protein (multidrug efflux system)
MMRFLSSLVLVTAACAATDPTPIEPSPTGATQARAVAAPQAAPDFTGVVTSRKSSVITAQVQGRIEKLAIHTGQPIKAGELVAKLDETELQNKLDQARSNEKSALMEAGGLGSQASALHQKVVAETRLQQLRVSSAMAVSNARAEYAQVSAQAAAAMARANTAKSTREQSEKDLARSTIVAPIDGIVTNIKAHEGEVAQLGTPLARVFDPSLLIIRFAVPKEHRATLKLGQRVELTIEGNKRTILAKVTNISGAQEPPINFTVAEADIDDARLTPGELTVAAVGRVRIAADVRGERQ